MIPLTHLGQYWSAARREVRLLACADVVAGGGRMSGAAYDVTEGLKLPGHRRRFREDHAGEDWDLHRWTYRSLPGPFLELVETVESYPNRTIAGWALNFLALAAGRGKPLDLAALDISPSPEADHLVAPVVPRRAQAFGVTYLNSALEREAEGARTDYGYVYRSVKERAERPEVFLKATAPEQVVGPNGRMGLRRDLTNSVGPRGEARERIPVGAGIEPELAAVIYSSGEVVGYCLADDVSANRIENESALYLPQAKHFTGCLVLGPLVLIAREREHPRIELAARILSAEGDVLFSGSSTTERMNAAIPDLLSWAGSHVALSPGEVILTGTDLVPGGEVRVLCPGMRVEIEAPAIGVLRHGAAEVPEGGLEEAAALNPDHDRWEFDAAA